MEWLFFLLPIAAISGWLAARSHYKKLNNQQNSPFSPEYFKGLNYLLNEQPDKAIDVFIRLLEVNSETVETHLALANLFRRRGETDRAIRIHQNLIARPSLTPQQRDQALVELGLDYMNAGVLDRAEHLFLELLTKPSPPPEAYQQLLRIYQQEKNWLQAIEMAKKIQSFSQEIIGPTIAQFYCELVEQQLASSPDSVLDLLKQANKHDQNCVRATLLEANLYMSAGKFRKAIKTLLRIEQQDNHYIPEALPKLLECYQQMNDLSAFNTWLESLLTIHSNMTSARLMLTHVIHLQHGSQAAQDYLHQQLPKHPSVEGLHTLISLGEQSNPILIPLVKGITNTMVRRGSRYSCQHCGFAGKTMHWHCPSCKKWGTVRPTEIHLSALESLLEPSK
ncbi:MAG: lipopolysaccharide assembly protein LapB [Gammaproteobacteria bacterium]|nr:MAG: lipopolysaccharide assembly protein LapB [Gammaproteobacteria bacterium]RKZ90754.1 MAG: lipopolysaccharide assembly protein LapB [Gammaproteobacteria bacterium]RKZ97422.1 MAG: lipopolysaccharide assembly protein LapB [Gammaproteobacteria bacterium]RKZ98035.1 MAG: lipopolysaccharide assembly protein LapB [Gammaproteobacteria bacterium]